MIGRERITGLVLAGGRGTRMGSIEKGLQPFRGEALVAHALRQLAPQVGPMAISANRCRDRYEAFGHPILGDAKPGHPGPLAGIASGLAACTTEWLAVVPCDAPFLPLDLVARLAAALTDDRTMAVARTGDRLHPVFCLMHVAMVRAPWVDGSRDASVAAWTGRHGAVAVDFDDEAAFRNLNTVDELAGAER